MEVTELQGLSSFPWCPFLEFTSSNRPFLLTANNNYDVVPYKIMVISRAKNGANKI